MDSIKIDASLCTGCGLCESSCPEVFKLNDDNVAEIVSSETDGCDINQIAEDCPVAAITIE